MNRTTFIAAIAATAVGVSAIAALANARGPDFSNLDKDGNGEITLEEMQAMGTHRFEMADADGDGFVTVEELESHGKAQAADRAEKMMSRMDTDDDGKLTLEEMQGRRDPARFFDRMDADNSGAISQEEFDEARAKMSGRHGKRKGQGNN